MVNGVIVIDKPLAKTSHDCVSFVRKLFGQKRVGHTGTLDPEATGVLPICLGMATKASDYMMNSGKEYTAGVKLGEITDTQDATGTILERHSVLVTKDQIEKVIRCFIGDIEQEPPMYSAIKQDGKKLYELARHGITVTRKRRPVTIEAISLETMDLENHQFTMTVRCSKGTYIRTLAHDIGTQLGCGAHMNYLRRTKSGGFSIEDAYSLEKLKTLSENGKLQDIIIPTDQIFDHFSAKILDQKQTYRVRNGIPIPACGEKEGLRFRLYDNDQKFLCVSTIKGNKLVMDTSFWCEDDNANN